MRRAAVPALARCRAAILTLGLGLAVGPPLAGCPTPTIPAPPDALTDAVAVLETSRARLSGITSLSIEARASYYAGGQARKGKVIILARRPASLHFSTLSPTDDLLGVLASDGERFMSFERGAPTCYVGPACPENVGRMLPLRMEGAAVVDLLMGGAPVVAHFQAKVTWDDRAGAYLVELQGDGGLVERLWIEHGSGLVRKAELRRHGTLELNLVYKDYATVAGHSLPHTLELDMTQGDVDLKIKYREVDVNTDVSDDAFAIPCPAGTTEQTLPCDGE